MSSVDNRVVNMTFNNAQFENGIKQSTQSIQNLKQNLQTLAEQKGMDNVADTFGSLKGAVDSVSLQNISASLDSLQSHFSVLGISGMTFVSELTKSFMGLGTTIKQNLIDPIVSGGWSRASNIEQAHFQITGLGKDWDALYKDMQYAVDGTAYGLDAAASAAGQLSASGIEAGTDMQTALRGISGTAAMTGRSYEDISRIWTTVAGNGRLMGDQLLQLSSSGVNAAAVLATALGTDEATVRDMVSKGQIDFATFSKAMDDAFGPHSKEANKTFTGAMSNVHAAMSKIGADFEGVLISSTDYEKGINNLISIANAYRNVLNALRTALKPVSTEFADTFHAIATVVTNSLSSMFETITTADGSSIIQFVKPLQNAFTNIRNSVKNVTDFILSISSSIGNAWNLIFPPITWETVEKLTGSIEKLTELLPKVTDISKSLYDAFGIDLTNGAMKSAYSIDGLRSGYDGIRGSIKSTNIEVSNSERFFSNLQSTFSGLFSILDLVKKGFEVVGKLTQTFIIPIISGLGEIIVAITGTVGDWLTVLDKIIPGFDVFGKDINGLSDMLSPFGEALSGVKDFIVEFIDAFKPGPGTIENIKNKIEEFTASLSPLGDGLIIVRNKIKDFFDSLSIKNIKGSVIGSNVFASIKNAFETVWNVISSIGSKIANAIKTVFETVSTAFKNLDFGTINKIYAILGGGSFVASLGVFAESCYKVASSVKSLTNLPGAFSNLLVSIKSFMNSLSDAVKAFTVQMDVNMFKTVAISIAILTGSLYVLSTIDPIALATSGAAIVGLMKALVQAASDLKAIGNNSFMKTATSLVVFSLAIVVLCDAVKKLSSLSIEDLSKGLIGIGAIGVGLAAFAKFMSKIDTKGFISTAIGMTIFAIAIKILASSVKELGQLDLENLEKGLVSIGILLTELGIFLSVTKLDGISAFKAVGIVLVASAIKILGDVVSQLGSLNLETIGQGLIGIGILLGEIAGFLELVGDNSMSLAGSIALVVTAGALLIFTNAVEQLGSMDQNSLAQGLTAIGLALLELTIGLNSVETGIGGALALLIAAAALNIMVPVLQALGSMSLDTIGTALIALGGSLIVLSLGLAMMAETGAGSLALLAAAVALSILTPVLQSLGSMSLDSICTALIALGGGFLVIALGAAALSPVISILLLFGVAVALVGIAVLAAGAGMAMMSASLPMLAVGLSMLAAVDSAGLLAVGLAAGAAGLAMLCGAPGLLLFGIAATVAGLGIGALAGSAGNMGPIADGLNLLSGVNYAPLLGLGAALIIFGAGAIPAGAGLLMLGIASLLVPGIVSGLNALSQIDGIAIGITGGALLLAAPGFLAFGVAALAMGVGMLVLGASAGVMPSVCLGLMMFSDVDGGAIAAVGVGMLAASAGILAFGAAALLSSAGILALGLVSPMLLSIVTNLSILSSVDGGSLAITGAALVILGAGSLVAGGGLVVLSGGAALAAVALVALSIAIISFVSILNGMIPEMDSAGESAVTGLAGGINNAGGMALDAIISLASSIIDAVISGLSSMFDSGFNAISNLGNGISGAIGSAISAASDVASGIADVFNNIGSWFHDVGGNIISGLVSGIQDGFGWITSVASGLAEKVLNAAKSVLGIASPSKEFAKIGMYSAIGFGNGLESYSYIAENSSKNMAENTLSAMGDIGSRLSDVINSNIDSSPIITPVLDLSEIQNGSGLIGNMLSAQSVSADYAYGQVQSIYSDLSSRQLQQESNARAMSDMVDKLDGIGSRISALESNLPGYISDNAPSLVLDAEGAYPLVKKNLQDLSILNRM